VLNIFFRGVTSRLPLGVAALIFCVPVGLRAQSQALIEKSQRGMELMAAGKFADAIPVYRELSRAVPDNPGLLLNLGMDCSWPGTRDRPLRRSNAPSNWTPARCLRGYF